MANPQICPNCSEKLYKVKDVLVKIPDTEPNSIIMKSETIYKCLECNKTFSYEHLYQKWKEVTE